MGRFSVRPSVRQPASTHLRYLGFPLVLTTASFLATSRLGTTVIKPKTGFFHHRIHSYLPSDMVPRLQILSPISLVFRLNASGARAVMDWFALVGVFVTLEI